MTVDIERLWSQYVQTEVLEACRKDLSTIFGTCTRQNSADPLSCYLEFIRALTCGPIQGRCRHTSSVALIDERTRPGRNHTSETWLLSGGGITPQKVRSRAEDERGSQAVLMVPRLTRSCQFKMVASSGHHPLKDSARLRESKPS